MSALWYKLIFGYGSRKHIEIIDELPKLSTEVYRHVVVRSTMYMTANAVVMQTRTGGVLGAVRLCHQQQFRDAILNVS